MILLANNLNKTFNTASNASLEVIKDVSLELEQNNITVIVGASGAGKSTLLHILSGLDKPDSGSVLIKGTDISSLPDEKLSLFRNKHIGFIFQFHHLLPEFTASENISIAQMISGESLKKAQIRSEELLDIVGLSERGTHKPAQLSGGEQQRVAVARAIVNNPEIVFADEPTGNLDSANSEIIHNLFIRLKEERGLTFLIATHNPEMVKLADRVIEIKDGIIHEKS
ncbi:MAG: ABC transporter ATP-binding protein [Ignavibacteria bacterium]|nr:ABC transporter ATP-binding protein [Ignavibacteria bacterium]